MPITIYSQQYIYDAQLLTTDDGLANLLTTAISKDKKGFIWIGTNYGLNRYDGYEFKLYNKEENGLISNKTIRNITEDKHGNLWLLIEIENNQKSRWQLDIFNPQTEQVIPFSQFFEGVPPFKADEVRKLTISENKQQIWITTISGQLYLYEAARFKKIYDRGDFVIDKLAVASEHILWAASEKTLIQTNNQGARLQDFTFDEDILKIYPEENGDVWVVTHSYKPKIKRICHIWLKEKDKPDFKPFSLEGINHDLFYIWNIIRSKDGSWYVPYEGHLLKFSSSGQQIFDFREIFDNTLMTDFHDYIETGTQIWFATPGGIFKTTSKVNPFQLIHKAEGLSDCRGITADETGNIYFINKGIHKWQSTSPLATKTLTNKGSYFLQYHQGNLLNGSYGPTFIGAQLDLANNNYHLMPSLIDNVGYSLQQTSNENTFYIGHNFGISSWDASEQKITSFEQYQKFPIFKQSKVFYIFKDGTDYWLATQNGIFLLDETQGIKAHYSKANGTLPFNHIQHIYKDKAGFFWLATSGNGIIRWDTKTFTYQTFTTNNGLSNNYVYAIYEDDFNHLWVSSDMGIMRINTSTFEVQNYTTKDGLPHNEFNFTAHYKAKDGNIYFGGLGGLITFHPKDFIDTISYHTPFTFTKLQILEEGIDESTNKTKLLSQTNDLIIQPTDKMIEVEFSLLDYESTENHSYAYNIEGYTNKWTYINENYIRIPHLPYGDYTLRIKGKSLRKEWSKQELTLNIHVLKPFYLQWWFITSLLLLIAGTGWVVVRKRELTLVKNQKLLEETVQQRTLTIQQQAEKLKSLDDLKSRFFANITHELKTPLTLIAAPLQDILNKESLPKKLNTSLTNIQQNAQKLINLVEELLDLSKMEHSRLKLAEEKITFYPFIRRLVAMHHSYAQYRAIDLIFHYEADQQLQVLIDVKKIEKIINNLLSNALKFIASDGIVQINVSDVEGQLRIEVSDTGTGIHPDDLPHIFERFFQSKRPKTASEGGAGIGLALSKEYAELMGGVLSVESKWKKGSTFTFLFPKKEVFGDIIDTSSADLIPSTIKSNVAIATAKPQLQQTILVVEDNKEMGEYLKSILETQHKVLLADNGLTALKRLEKYPVDLILSDVMMPQMDGFQLLEAVKQKETLFSKPFIMVTARTETPDRLKALQLGVADYLAKPFLSEELLARVNNLLNNYNARKAYLKEAATTTSFSYQPITASAATLWLEEVENIVKKNIQNPQFNVARLAILLIISESSLRQKLKAHTGLSPVAYIREARLAKARHLLENQRYTTIAEVVYAIGMKHPANFTKMYKKRFGKLPSEYL